MAVLPGTMTVYLPWRYFGIGRAVLDWGDPVHWAGLGLIVLGAALLGTCIWEFAHSGRGTLSPLDPPSELVAKGLYRYVRNPMYVSVGSILLGELLLVPSSNFLMYILAGVLVVNLFVIGYEEPYLRRQFGESYQRYCKQVGRWIPF